jgi:hypothetical protein
MDLGFSLSGKSNDTYPQHHEKVSILAEALKGLNIDRVKTINLIKFTKVYLASTFTLILHLIER